LSRGLVDPRPHGSPRRSGHRGVGVLGPPEAARYRAAACRRR
jgi:hypothetical protein